MEERIVTLAKALGYAGEEDTLRVLCRAAAEELTGRLRPDVFPEDCGESFALGAAWLALAGLAVDSGGGERITAGSLTIQERSGKDALERSAALRSQAERVMAPYLRDTGFSFLGVRG